MPGQLAHEGLSPAASLLGPPGQPQRHHSLLHLRFQQRCWVLSLPVLPATSHCPMMTSPLGLSHPPTSSISPSGLTVTPL